mgnify:CR=1 FL=1
MKRFYQIYLLCIVLLASATSVLADTNCTGYKPTHPDHYCDCKYNISQLATLPFDVQVTDSIWFKAGSNLFINGFTAYLYSDCDVNFDLYQNCISHTPLYSVTIPKNQARDVTAETINQKLEEAGVSITSMALYLCIYPVGGTGGRLMCYPYNTGHNSTCEDILSLLPGMTFVSSHENDVYEITSSSIPSSYAMYLQWNEDSNLPCHLSITRGECNGTIIAEYDFVDENSRYYFDPALLIELNTSGESLYAHFSHDAAAAGRIRLSEASTIDIPTDTTVCQGKALVLDNMIYTTDTTIIYDRQWQGDQLAVYAYHLTIAEPELQYDTLHLKSSDLPMLYRNQFTIPANGFGDYDITIHQENTCDERYLLHVAHATQTIYSSADTTICQGRSFTYNGQKYTTDVTFTDSTWINADTLSIHTLNVYFAEPEIQYDTLLLKSYDLPYRYRSQYTIPADGFGDYDFTLHFKNNCDERYLVHVAHDITTYTNIIDTTVCQGRTFTYNQIEYSADTTLVDTLWIDNDTRDINILNLYFAAPELQYDTLRVQSTDLPMLYRNQFTIPAGGYGDYDIIIHNDGMCDEHYLLHVEHETLIYMNSIDTTLCQGRIFEYNGVEYTVDTTFMDTGWLNEDVWKQIQVTVTFTAPEMEYDSVIVPTAELLAGYYYPLANTYIYAEGTYFYEILTYNDCTRHITLTVIEDIKSGLNNPILLNRPRLIMIDGTIFVQTATDRFTILGEKVTNHKANKY